MKFALILFAGTMCGLVVFGQPTTENRLADNGQKLDMKDIEKLLQQIEAEENKVKPAKDDSTVSESLQKLFSTFRQMTSAYINVLNSVNKSLGLPKYPSLPGLSRQARQNSPPTPLKQIQENLNQLQNTASEVGSLVRRVVSNMTTDSRKTVLNQFRKFTDLWSKQLSEISSMLDNSINNRGRQDDQQTLFNQINQYIQQVTKSIRTFANNVVSQIRDRIVPTMAPRIETDSQTTSY